jgi:hypothetical protein
MDTKLIKGYMPFKAEHWERIKALWDLYKIEFSLEGDLYISLKSSNALDGEIDRQIEERRARVAGNIEAWHKLGSER